MTTHTDFIVRQFIEDVSIHAITPLKGGLINKTYLVKTQSKELFVLQQINTNIFPEVAHLMENLNNITQHFSKKITAVKPDFPVQSFRYYKPKKSSLYFYKHTDNTYWRLSDYIENVALSNVPITNNIATEVGKLFGFFISSLSDINLKEIHEIIPEFHNTKIYFKRLQKAEKEDLSGRLKNTQTILAKIYKNKWIMEDYVAVVKTGRIPVRLVHNDSKTSNILFDDASRAIAIIDLDTCMPGYLMNDFGDSIRSLANNGKEDDRNLKNVSFNIELFKSYASGFLSATKKLIRKEEKDNLALFSLLLTYEQAIRFYTDYLNNDAYYQTEYETHNLQRTKAQLKLLDDMLLHFNEMKSIVAAL